MAGWSMMAIYSLMVPLTPRRELLGPYSEALLAYLTEGRESALEQARELGRRAMANGIRPAEMSSIHHESVRRVLAGRKGGEGQEFDAVSRVGTFFAESLSPFETERLELRRANLALRYRNNKLECDAQRFSQLVYDDAMQLLAAVRLAVAAVPDEPQPGTCGVLNEIRNLLRQVEEQLAECSAVLWPRVLGDLGLGPAIQSLTWRFSESARLDITADAEIGPLPPEIGMAVYEAVQEALTNVVRHARANRVRIRLCEECSVIRCSIRDDGVGFDVSEVLPGAEDQCSGLSYISESLRSVGGTLMIDSVPNGGTEVRISIGQSTL
jgi:signal transduction histidine kinase